MDFKEVYKFPFKVVNDGMYCISSNGTKALTASSKGAMEHIIKIAAILNGETDERYKPEDIAVQKAKLCIMEEIIIVRGWGRLIGSGGFNLQPSEAAKIQDGFIQWLIKTITT